MLPHLNYSFRASLFLVVINNLGNLDFLLKYIKQNSLTWSDGYVLVKSSITMSFFRSSTMLLLRTGRGEHAARSVATVRG